MKKLLTFTEAVVRGPDIPGATRRFADNFPALGVKHSGTGRRTYIFQSRLANGDQTTIQLGRVGLIKLTDAWDLARQAYLDTRAGKNPNVERRTTADSFGNLTCTDGTRVVKDANGGVTIIPGGGEC